MNKEVFKKILVNSNYVYLHHYCSNNLNLHKFTWIDVGDFRVRCAKFTSYTIIHGQMD